MLKRYVFLHVLIFKLLLRCRQFRLGVLFATGRYAHSDINCVLFHSTDVSIDVTVMQDKYIIVHCWTLFVFFY